MIKLKLKALRLQSRNLFIVALLLLVSSIAFAQTASIATADTNFTRYSLHAAVSFKPSNYYVLKGMALQSKELNFARSLSNNMHIVWFANEKAFEAANKIYALLPANDDWKLSPALELKKDRINNTQTFLLGIRNIQQFKRTKDSLHLPVELLQFDTVTSTLVVKAKAGLLAVLQSLPEVNFIDLKANAVSEAKILGYDRSYHGINRIDYDLPGLNGNNIVVGIKEQQPDANDIDLIKRILPSSIAAGNSTEHATVVASIIGGAGNSYYDGRGLAWGCHFFPSSFENLFPDNASILQGNAVFVQNHSYGTIVQQFYGAEAMGYDAQLWSNKKLLHVFSAGNAGTDAAAEGKYAGLKGFANLTANFKNAKNVITVAALDRFGSVASLSSSGPLYDGRLAPQITALGPGGTSDAAAIVSGTIALMQQAYATSNNNSMPDASLLKALIYNTADDIYSNGIDYKTGYGVLNSFKAINALKQQQYFSGEISNGETWKKTIHLPANIANLKITLCWTDSNATVNNNQALINDLDLELKQVNINLIYKPWVLSQAANIDSLAKPAIRKRDSLNTAELISLELPTEGDYEISVKGYNVVNAKLPFHIAYNMDTLNTFSFTNPEHTSDVNRFEKDSLAIKWDTQLANKQATATLSISYNRGLSWQIINSAVLLSSKKYNWPIKDTSSTVQFRMQTSFGSFLSREIILSDVTNPTVDFNCSDSFSISWRRYPYATAYNIYAQTDSPYLRLLKAVPDTFVHFNKSTASYTRFAVEPINSNGIPAARSRILDINLQNTGCYYNSFYYALQDGNNFDLILNVSAPALVDSLVFQQVDRNGNLLKTVGRLAATAGNSNYQQLVQDPPIGSSYWRVLIKLKSGAISSTEIISIHTTGKQYIQFYPNPTQRSKFLTYLLQQGIGTDAQLQLFDLTGRMLKYYKEMPDRINVSAFAAGLVIYKLLSSEGRLLETGKILIN